ncbi:MAG: hypothetical protein ABI758_06520 [Candidatus Woesebacteria bacterium]
MKEYAARGRVKIKNITPFEGIALLGTFGLDTATFGISMLHLFTFRAIPIDREFFIALFGIHAAQLINIVRLKRH